MVTARDCFSAEGHRSFVREILQDVIQDELLDLKLFGQLDVCARAPIAYMKSNSPHRLCELRQEMLCVSHESVVSRPKIVNVSKWCLSCFVHFQEILFSQNQQALTKGIFTNPVHADAFEQGFRLKKWSVGFHHVRVERLQDERIGASQPTDCFRSNTSGLGT